MTNSPPFDIALYWTDSLSDELLRFLTRRVKCPEAAADLTHETFLRLHDYVKTNPPDNARALAYRIAVNLATDYQRKIKVRENLTVEIDPELLANMAASATPEPEQIVMDRQRFSRFEAVLAELPTDCRTAFRLHSIHGLTYAQIAAQLGISISMVYKHLSRALEHCIRRMDEEE
jgi:RNA polymerase sigma factor (sigma-70 family)